jgi:hypothetical protein
MNVLPLQRHSIRSDPQFQISGEEQFGIAFLGQLQSILKTRRLIAVGEIAHRSLDLAGLPHRTVRHPSHGGKSAFQRGLLAI